ncbi:hypothetical protein IM40_07055 [Candidatus Paracaedimonas acanthamoebae]|nr:hypothetical protein IM40_07055 [Candidatus Paracaedimonas acanthamoebae]
MMNQPLDVSTLIVGAGPVGATLALALAQAGVKSAIVDTCDPAQVLKKEFDGRTIAISHGSHLIFKALGLWEELSSFVEPIKKIHISQANYLGYVHYDEKDSDGFAMGYIIENRHLRRILFKAIFNNPLINCRISNHVKSLDRQPFFIEATLEQQEKLKVPLVVAADGRNSITRQQAGLKAHAWSYQQIALVGVLKTEFPHENIAFEHFLPSGPLALLPMQNDLCSFVWSIDKQFGEHLLTLSEQEFSDQLRASFGDYLGKFELASQRWSYPLGGILVPQLIAERLALIGDAAHVIHPVAGQGLNLGFRDAVTLAEVLVDAARVGIDIGSAQVLERYQRWRRFDVLTLTSVTDLLVRSFSNDSKLIGNLRMIGLRLTHRLPVLKRVMTQHAMGLLGEKPRLLQGLPL